MLKRILAALLLAPLLALAQSYPSPTFQNVTVQGTLTAATPAFTNPLPVSSGGTGVATFTTGNVLVGAAGGGLTTVGPGSADLPLVSNGAGFVPSFRVVNLDAGGTSANNAAQARTNLGAAATASPLSQFAATTSVQLAGVISDETGSGALVFGTAPTINNLNATGTPTAPTATTGTNTTQIATTAFVLANSGGCTSCTITTPNIVGVTNGGNAAAGSVGEFITATGTSVSLTSGTPANITSITLSAGDWDVSGNTEFDAGGSTTISAAQTAVTTSSATNGAGGVRAITTVALAAGGAESLVAPVQRFSVSGSTTVFLTAQCTFATSTLTATGIIRARRVR